MPGAKPAANAAASSSSGVDGEHTETDSDEDDAEPNAAAKSNASGTKAAKRAAPRTAGGAGGGESESGRKEAKGAKVVIELVDEEEEEEVRLFLAKRRATRLRQELIKDIDVPGLVQSPWFTAHELQYVRSALLYLFQAQFEEHFGAAAVDVEFANDEEAMAFLRVLLVARAVVDRDRS